MSTQGYIKVENEKAAYPLTREAAMVIRKAYQEHTGMLK